jgi:predicted transcriptional regulator
VVHIRFDNKILAKVDLEAAQTDRTRSNLIQKIVKDYFEK